MNSEIFEMYRDCGNVLLPELDGLGWCSTVRPHFGGRRTDGRIGFEVGYLHQGSMEWLSDNELDEAGPGSVTVEWPGEWQGGENAIIHPCERYWVRFNFQPAGRLPGLPPTTVSELETRFANMTSRHFPASSQMKGYFEQLIGQQREPGIFAEDVSRAAFHQILLLTVHDYDRIRPANYSPAIRYAISFFDTHFEKNYLIEDVAQNAKLSVGYFHELFVAEVGLTPGRYHLSRRIACAKRDLIYSDKSIISLSMDLGFSSSQYFATAFKKVVGMPPGEYRALRQGEPFSQTM